MANEMKFKSIPANACLLSVGEITVKDNGEGAKTAPISLVARSGKPIEHWFWGKVVHDLAGMRLNKKRVAIDYCHDDKEIIGYLNHFDSASGDLVTSGALVPFKDSDRATEIIHKQRAGIPYEASINFGGDGIKVEEVAEGQVAQVNGYMLDGPAVIIREWPLRGVAICPYGADENTESTSLSENSKTFSATVASVPVPVTEPANEETHMSESVEGAAVGTEDTQAATTETSAEASPAEVAQTVEADAVETEQKPAESAEVTALKADNDRIKTELAQAQDVADKALKAKVEAEQKLAAIESGENRLSATPATTKPSGNMFARARENRK